VRDTQIQYITREFFSFPQTTAVHPLLLYAAAAAAAAATTALLLLPQWCETLKFKCVLEFWTLCKNPLSSSSALRLVLPINVALLHHSSAPLHAQPAAKIFAFQRDQLSCQVSSQLATAQLT
jgi:hypothetical protein